MTRSRLFGVVSITLSAFATWIYLITQVQPDRNDSFIFIAFFVSQTVWIGSVLAAIIYFTKVRKGNREIIYAHINPSIRQGFLIASYLSGLLFLQFLRVLSAWDALLILCVFILFEIAARHTHTTGKAPYERNA